MDKNSELMPLIVTKFASFTSHGLIIVPQSSKCRISDAVASTMLQSSSPLYTNYSSLLPYSVFVMTILAIELSQRLAQMKARMV